MKFIRLLVFALFLAPFGAMAQPSEFTVAAQLLAAAKNADIQQVQTLVNNGANVNFVDSTGLSLVCTALMNNDLRAAQILQMYGADASQCDKQIQNYKTRNTKERTTGGLFGGLSTAQGLVLAAAGAAVVVGGIFLLTDWFDPDNDNNATNSSGGGHGGGGGGGSSDAGTAWSAGAIPYGPAMPNAASETANYSTNLAVYAPSDTTSILYQNFQLMNNTENYLLLMHGYSPLARGYMGMRTLRRDDHSPILLNGASFGADSIEGGRPVNVALVTANGIDARANTSLENKFFVWTSVNADNTPSGASLSTISSKYYNNVGTFTAVNNYSAVEDASLLGEFDLSNSGTAIHNPLAAGDDNLLAKIVGGYTSGYTNADFIGFMPYGQMTIYRTGGGTEMANASGANGTCTRGGADCSGETFQDDDILTLFGKSLKFEFGDENTVTLTSTAEGDDTTYYGYIGTDSLLYVTSGVDGFTPRAYALSDGTVTQKKAQGNTYYKNYAALKNAINLATTTHDESDGGRSKVDIIANVDVVKPWHDVDALVIDDVFEGTSSAEERTDKFLSVIEDVYSSGMTGTNVRNDAGNFFQAINVNGALAVFSTGGAVQSDGTYSDTPKIATIENAAPIVYQNLNHSFMSVVAVGARTDGATSIAANSDNLPVAGTKYQLAKWAVPTGDENNPYIYYKSRVCGMSGRGYGNIDPWCFAAVGITDENATAAAAGAAGALRGAFDYMTPQQIFTLMALTADGPYLNRLTGGTQLNEQTLISHLQSLYEMPGAYQTKIDLGQLTYLQAFAEVYGYGVINLERATTPGTNLYFYDGDKIVSSTGKNAYWRAASNTRFMGSGALNLGRGAVDVAAYDILESVDGSMRLPRIWESSFSFDEPSRHGLYMGDVLGDLHTRKPNQELNKVGNFGFGITLGNYLYDDGMGGVDSLRAEYDHGNWKLLVDYQHYLTDGQSRFDGRSNPIWAIASNATTAGAEYKYGNWSFGGRAFSGTITDEGLLQYDPAISATVEPRRLGMISGAQTGIGWGNKDFGLNTAFGIAHENNTVLGAYATGLFDLGDADTTYIDIDAFWQPFDAVRIGARATFAETTPNSVDGAIMRLSELKSNAFSVGLDIENLSFGVSMPLAVTRGNASYAYANYDVVEDDFGRYDLVMTDAGMRDIDVAPGQREVRFNATYRHNFGPFTDGAVGFIYRVNPNNMHDFGNESIFMMKLSHLIGI